MGKLPRLGDSLIAFARQCGPVFTLLLLLGGARAEEPLRIVHPRGESSIDDRVHYPLAVLRLALQRSGSAYVLHPNTTSTQQSRSLRMLEHGGLDVAWSMGTEKRAERLLTIPIPIDRGLLGWRLLLIRRGDAARFGAVHDLNDLRRLRAGLGHDWPDVDVFRDRGLPVVDSPNYEGLFEMLARDRFDYFPRSLVEIFAELEQRQTMGLEIEPALLLRYRAGLYFFVCRERRELAQLIERGLRASMTDGSFDALFEAEFGELITRATLGERRAIDLNPGWPPEAAAAGQSGLWFEAESSP
ncbi:MAG: hypothetical protein ACT4NL_00625 [Pseudomarimonas sp.]